MSRLNKNLQSKRKETKRHMYMFILSQKTKMPMSWASPELYLSSPPALCLRFMCPVVTKHTGGKLCDGV